MKTGGKQVGLFITFIVFVFLILDSKYVFTYAADGIDLCLRSVIPALFPLIVLSIYITGNLTGGIPILGSIGKLCRIPRGSEAILLTGLLGGYPVGAQAVTQAWEAGVLSGSDAGRMLGFCNNAGPAFLFGIIAPMFQSTNQAWLLWLIHVTAALITGILLPGGNNTETEPIHRSIPFPKALERGIRVMASICGWVVIFRIFIGILNRWCFCFLPEEIEIFFNGILELTNGCLLLEGIGSEALRFLMASVFLSLGGICVGMQTLSVTGKLGLGDYFPGKLLQTFLSISICGSIYPIELPYLLHTGILGTALLSLFLHFGKNNSSIFPMQRV